MAQVLALGVLLFAFVGGLVGVRLLRLARRTRGLPEALVGVWLVACAVGGSLRFHPPARYRRALRARDEAPASA